MDIKGKRIGVGLTGSFCSFQLIFQEMEKLAKLGADLYPITSHHVQTIECRFGTPIEYKKRIKEITGKDPIETIADAEPIGPKDMLDIMLLAPCTGNTMAKLVNGITDGPVLMAAKSHLRVGKPLVLSLATNDALGANFKNIGQLYPYKNIYFVPFGQDEYKKKPYSMVAHTELITETIEKALDGQQIQPVIQSPHRFID